MNLMAYGGSVLTAVMLVILFLLALSTEVYTAILTLYARKPKCLQSN